MQGGLLGGLYALFAVGLSLIFGIMRLVNIAHGDLIMLAAFVALVAAELLGIHPLATLIVVVPVMFALGYALQRGVLNLTLGESILPPLLVTFGMSIIIQNALLEIFGADTHRLASGALETASIALPGGITIGVFPLIIFLVAVAIIGGLQLIFFRTDLGRAFRADFRRSGNGRAHGHRQPPSLRPRHGDRDGGHRLRRRVPGGPHQFRSVDRADRG